MYNNIPNYKRCVELVDKYPCLSKSTQSVGTDIEIVSFKYNYIPPEEIWEEEGAINMRGISFINEKVVALPYPKFFNLNENKTTQGLDITKFKYCLEKIDGSLISVFKLPNGVSDLKTMKSIASDVAIQAKYDMFPDKVLMNWCSDLIDKGETPLFEYVSYESRIVLDYNGTFVYFLGTRNVNTGEMKPFFDYSLPDNVGANVRTPRIFYNDKEVQEYLKQDGIEGVVMTLESGQMIKLKTEEYCQIHRVISIASPKQVIIAFYNDTLDDAKAILESHKLVKELELVKRVEKEYITNLDTLILRVTDYLADNPDFDNKDIAKDLMQRDKRLANAIFSYKKEQMNKIEYIIYKEMIEEYKQRVEPK